MSVPPHPYGVQPEGNLWLMEPGAAHAARTARTSGLGKLADLDDLTVLRICSFAGPSMLAALCATSNTVAAFASSEEFWQSACLRRAGGDGFAAFRQEPFTGFCGSSWKATYIAAMKAENAGTTAPATATDPLAELAPRKGSVSVFSDTLYRSHELIHAPSAFGKSPSGPPCERIAHDTNMPDVAEFSSTYEAGAGRPVVLEGAGVSSTTAKTWDEASLREQLGDRVFHAGGVNMRLREYFDYAHTNSDDQPLYCFDPTFAKSAPELLEAYDVPAYFRDDLFSLLETSGARPDYRWLLIGGVRSGQSWHKDPNGTSAWNLTIRGRKRWLFFPPHITPPGVIMSGDGSKDYMTPISLAEWARGYYKEACSTPGLIECETKAGEVMYVPRGWWHMVLNLELMTFMVSHHFLSPTGLYNTLRLLREAPHQVSGIDRGLAPRDSSGTTHPDSVAEDHKRRTAAGKAMHDRLVDALRENRPEVLACAEEQLRCERERVERKRDRLIAQEDLFRSRKKAFARSGGATEAAPAPFAFNFAQS